MVMNDMTDDGKAVLQPIDWSAPIEAVHEDGRTMSAIIEDGPTEDDVTYGIRAADRTYYHVKADGSHFQNYTKDGWRIRNVQPATQTQTQTLTAQERLEKYEGFLRGMAGENLLGANASPYEWQAQARALVAEMEPEVDGDLVEAKSLVEELTDHDVAWTDQKVSIALAAIRRGRELARGDVA